MNKIGRSEASKYKYKRNILVVENIRIEQARRVKRERDDAIDF